MGVGGLEGSVDGKLFGVGGRLEGVDERVAVAPDGVAIVRLKEEPGRRLEVMVDRGRDELYPSVEDAEEGDIITSGAAELGRG